MIQPILVVGSETPILQQVSDINWSGKVLVIRSTFAVSTREALEAPFHVCDSRGAFWA